MASLITVRLYNDNLSPKIWASPLLSAILQEDKSLALDSVAMEEVWDWFYQYEYENYDRNALYFFFIDWETYDDINKLDSYGNKNTWWRDNSVIINTEKLAKDIWSAKEKDMLKDTVGAKIFSLNNTSTEELELNINNLFLQTFIKSDELQASLKMALSEINIPEQLKVKDIIKPIENIINNSIKAYYDNTLEWLETIKTTIVDNISLIEKYDDSSTKEEVNKLYLQIEEVNKKIDWLKSIEIKLDDNKDISNEVNDSMDWIKNELLEINRKMNILFTRLNSR